MIAKVLEDLNKIREINYKRYRDSNMDAYLHYCSGLDTAIAMLKDMQFESEQNKSLTDGPDR